MATIFRSGLQTFRSVEMRRPGTAVWSSALSVTSRMAAGYHTLVDGKHPVIDMTPILQNNHPDRAIVVQHIGGALRQRGYFYAQNVEMLSADYIRYVYDYSSKLHALPTDVKKQYVANGAYSGLDVGIPELDYAAGSVSPVRAWDYSRGATSYPSNEEVEPSFLEVVDDLYERQNQLASALYVVFAEMLDLPPRTFADMFGGQNGAHDVGLCRLLHYPGNAEMSEDEIAKSNVGISAHTDFEVFTLMHQDAPGLQFIPASGEGWIDAPVRPGEFVVILADVLERFTNGVLRATPHRVVKTPHKRMSIIRFNAVTAETVVEPLPQFVTDERPAAYSWVTMGTHMETTIRNLAAGNGAWDVDTQTSLTATYPYVDGKDPIQAYGTDLRHPKLTVYDGSLLAT